MKHLISLSLVLSLSLVAAACGDDEHQHDTPDAASGADAPTTADGGADGGANAVDITVQFAAEVGGVAFACNDGAGNAKAYTGLGTVASTAAFKDFRFYVSNVRLINDADVEVPLTMTTDGAWQLQTAGSHVALLDFEDGTQSCADTGNAPMNTTITGTVPAGTYTGLVFDVGVPFDLNHLDVNGVGTMAPLNIGAMMWAWASGHKFMRVDYAVEGANVWNFHLGSTMCVSDGMTTPPTAECGRPNRFTVTLPTFDTSADTVVFDAAAIVATTDITANVGMTPGCMSFPADEGDCTALFTKLGLSYSTGACTTDCTDQVAFTKR